jgi:1,4-dihydroxy-2-naphthoate octaprenyltransferase
MNPNRFFSKSLVGGVIALGYTRMGFCLKYAALGDISFFFAFGVLPMFGTYWVQTQNLVGETQVV